MKTTLDSVSEFLGPAGRDVNDRVSFSEADYSLYRFWKGPIKGSVADYAS